MASKESKEKKTMKLDDAQRVKVLSPGMLVAKRFFRNKLAIVGLAIITFMLLFTFLGAFITPYKESQVFYTTENMQKDYAGATVISDYQRYEKEDTEVPKDVYSKAILAMTKNEAVFETRDKQKVAMRAIGEDAVILYRVANSNDKNILKSAEYKEASASNSSYFESKGKSYFVDNSSRFAVVYEANELAIMCKLSFNAFSEETKFNYEFCQKAILAMNENNATFTVDNETYKVDNSTQHEAMICKEDGTNYAYISNMNINSIGSGVFLTPQFKEEVSNAIANNLSTFEYENENGEKEIYTIENDNGEYLIQSEQETRVINMYESPSKKHWFGTDGNGMDMLTRLMYGGRISLLIGLVVVAVEVILGVIVGGVSGYFGGWIDNLCMRIVDVIYCIPSLPLYLILGSIMDHYKASPQIRIFALCIMMSVIGWVGVARIVRAQILSLREQEFMIATEATGIRISRRIFKHLVPNVMPQLIVYATMGVGDVILAEAALSFLGFGTKYPAASWGSIINAVNESYVMTNYLFAWVPAGILILLTVLAFNFIGDGLRDAFDPKMKR